MTGQSNCDVCMNFIYDEEYECYICDMDLDQDEMGRFLTNTFDNCPYFRLGDEYKIVENRCKSGYCFRIKNEIEFHKHL